MYYSQYELYGGANKTVIIGISSVCAIIVLCIIIVVIYNINQKKKESERIAAEEEAKRKAAEALAEKKKDREQIREETEEMITTETSPMKKNISENTKNITLNTEKISEHTNKIGIISNNYDALNKIVQDKIDENNKDHKELGVKISGNHNELTDEIKLINKVIANVRAPYISATHETGRDWVRVGGGKDAAIEGQLILAKGENELDAWVVNRNGEKTVKPIHGAVVPKDVIDVVYPVGSVIVRFDLTNPEDIFPGTKWKKIDGNYLLTTNPQASRNDNLRAYDPVYIKGDLNKDVPMALLESQIPSHTHGVGSYKIEGATHSHDVSDKGSNSITILIKEAILKHTHGFKGPDNKGVTLITSLDGAHEHTYDHPTGKVKKGFGAKDAPTHWQDEQRKTSKSDNHHHKINLLGVTTDAAETKHTHSISAIQGKTQEATPQLTLKERSAATGGSAEHQHELKLPQLYCTVWVRIA